MSKKVYRFFFVVLWMMTIGLLVAPATQARAAAGDEGPACVTPEVTVTAHTPPAGPCTLEFNWPVEAPADVVHQFYWDNVLIGTSPINVSTYSVNILGRHEIDGAVTMKRCTADLQICSGHSEPAVLIVG